MKLFVLNKIHCIPYSVDPNAINEKAHTCFACGLFINPFRFVIAFFKFINYSNPFSGWFSGKLHVQFLILFQRFFLLLLLLSRILLVLCTTKTNADNRQHIVPLAKKDVEFKEIVFHIGKTKNDLHGHFFYLFFRIL